MSKSKWPATLTMIRHGESEYNALYQKKNNDPLYQEFVQAFNKDIHSPNTKRLAQEVYRKFNLPTSNPTTPLNEEGHRQARITGKHIGKHIPKPDVIFVSPYTRTRQTFKSLIQGGLSLKNAKIEYDPRVREQEYGLAALHSDKRVFHALYPEQRDLFQRDGRYWYRQPQGESVDDVRARLWNIQKRFRRKYKGMNVLIVTHHLTILAARCNLEHLDEERFIALDKHEKPVNCGITSYREKRKHLKLDFYNKKLW